MPPVITFYISGHGFGHASRAIEVLRALHARRPDARLIVRTTVPRWLFDLSAPPIEYHEVACGTGVAQIDSLRLDAAATLQAAERFYATFPDRIAREAEALRASGTDLVLSDIPPLASAAAAAAGLRAVLIGNFTWDWIYEDYQEFATGGPALLQTIRDAYRPATLALRLPMWGGFASVGAVIRDIPFIARHATRAPAELRRAVGLDDNRPIVLLSFGGHGLRDFDPAGLAAIGGYTFVTAERRPLPARPAPHVVVIDTDSMYEQGFRYEDLVAAADIVVTKPGYGIVAEAIANDTAILYTSRGRFPEYEVIVSAMQRLTRCRYIPMPDLLGGHWQGHLDRLRQEPRPAAKPATNGAEVAAETVLGMLETNER